MKANVGGIKKIEDMGGAVLYSRKRDNESYRVLPPNTVKTMNKLLIAVVKRGTGKGAEIRGLSMAGKTGTSQDYRDGWFIGYTNNLVVGVWIGNDDGSPTKKVVGGGLPAKVWKKFMKSAVDVRTAGIIPIVAEQTQGEKLPWRKDVELDKRKSFWDRVLGN